MCLKDVERCGLPPLSFGVPPVAFRAVRLAFLLLSFLGCLLWLLLLLLRLPVLLLLGVPSGSVLALAFPSRPFARSRGVRLSWSPRWGRGWRLALPCLRVVRLARCLLGLSVAARSPSLVVLPAGSGCLVLCLVRLCRCSLIAFACLGLRPCLSALASSGALIPPSGSAGFASLSSFSLGSSPSGGDPCGGLVSPARSPQGSPFWFPCRALLPFVLLKGDTL